MTDKDIESIVRVAETWPRNYNETASDYDLACEKREYIGPRVVADAAAACVEEALRPQMKVIDIAAGTGLLGVELQSRGFKNIDALEPCKAMFDIAREKKVHSELISDVIDGHKTEIPNGHYDVVAASGGFGPGLIPVEGLTELVRIAKPGGWIVFAIRRQFFESVDDYKYRLIPCLESMQADGILTLTITEVQNYVKGKAESYLLSKKPRLSVREILNWFSHVRL